MPCPESHSGWRTNLDLMTSLRRQLCVRKGVNYASGNDARHSGANSISRIIRSVNNCPSNSNSKLVTAIIVRDHVLPYNIWTPYKTQEKVNTLVELHKITMKNINSPLVTAIIVRDHVLPYNIWTPYKTQEKVNTLVELHKITMKNINSPLVTAIIVRDHVLIFRGFLCKDCEAFGPIHCCPRGAPQTLPRDELLWWK